MSRLPDDPAGRGSPADATPVACTPAGAAAIARPHPLAGLDLAIFDKDGTLIEFEPMWAGWVLDLADRLAAEDGGRHLDAAVYEVMGVDQASGRILPHGGIAATPMARLRDDLIAAISRTGMTETMARRLVAAAWHAPDPVRLARPTADLRALLGRLRAGGVRIAVATSDDRDPTERTLAHLAVADLVEAVACADDGRPVKPDPAAVHWICRSLGIAESGAAVIGDSPADLAMGRAAGAGLTIGVLTGVGDRDALSGAADLIVTSVRDLVPPA